jgi:hypothetical protein
MDLRRSRGWGYLNLRERQESEEKCGPNRQEVRGGGGGGGGAYLDLL